MATSPLAFQRRRDDRLLTGVAGGFADQHGVNVVVVRAALVILTFAGGLGIALYTLGFVLSESESEALPPPTPPDLQRDLAVTSITFGLVLVMRATGVWLGDPFMAIVITVVIGVALLLGPWMSRTAQQIAEERRQRIRSEERERIAVHLHDSVLQTLALIQRSADDPRRTVTLARRQEHELREWLYGSGTSGGGTLSAAVHAMAGEVEELYDVRVEVVVVADQPMNDDFDALVGAIRESCVNAAKHSGAESVAVYVEVTVDQVDAYVRDRGRGFDPTVAADDRKGIVHSIEARVKRVGGTATIVSATGQGTEVHLMVPVRREAEGPVRV